MAENEICGTKDPTFHRLLLDTRFELPLGLTFISVVSIITLNLFCINLNSFFFLNVTSTAATLEL